MSINLIVVIRPCYGASLVRSEKVVIQNSRTPFATFALLSEKQVTLQLCGALPKDLPGSYTDVILAPREDLFKYLFLKNPRPLHLKVLSLCSSI